ncbi:MAG: fatty acid desaturase family protein [Pseudomonadota bacterium]
MMIATSEKAANRIRPHDVFTDAEWDAISRREAWRGPMLVVHAWALIAAAIALFAAFPNPLTYVLAIMIVGARQLGLAILMHDAAHGALHPRRAVNDVLGHWLTAAPVGASLQSYRAYHLKHHKYVQEASDPDRPLVANYPTSRASLRRKFVRDLTGQTFYAQRVAGLFSAEAKSDAAAKQAEVLAGRNALRDHLLTNLVIFLVLTLAGVWWAYPAIWLTALATWFPFVTRVRNIAEHACLSYSEDPLAHARTVHAGWWERLFIAPYWVHYHSEHHAFMHLPCYRLPATHAALKAKGASHRIPQAKGYAEVLATVSSG